MGLMNVRYCPNHLTVRGAASDATAWLYPADAVRCANASPVAASAAADSSARELWWPGAPAVYALVHCSASLFPVATAHHRRTVAGPRPAGVARAWPGTSVDAPGPYAHAVAYAG